VGSPELKKTPVLSICLFFTSFPYLTAFARITNAVLKVGGSILSLFPIIKENIQSLFIYLFVFLPTPYLFFGGSGV
jgi:hypothetical protein